MHGGGVLVGTVVPQTKHISPKAPERKILVFCDPARPVPVFQLSESGHMHPAPTIQ